MTYTVIDGHLVYGSCIAYSLASPPFSMISKTEFRSVLHRAMGEARFSVRANARAKSGFKGGNPCGVIHHYRVLYCSYLGSHVCDYEYEYGTTERLYVREHPS